MSHRKHVLRVIPLGGLDEIGKNMTVFEYGDDMVVVDAGIMFPDDELPGVDLDAARLLLRRQAQGQAAGIIITHGHEDHTGALPYLLKTSERQVPVLGTSSRCGLIQGKLEEHKLKKTKLREVKAGMPRDAGHLRLRLLRRQPLDPGRGGDASSARPSANVVHTGDFKLDQTPIDGRMTDYGALAKFGQRSVWTFSCRTPPTPRPPAYTRSEATVGDALRRHHRGRAEQRVIVASFSSHIHRSAAGLRRGGRRGRKVVVTGRSMITNTGIARELGYLDID